MKDLIRKEDSFFVAGHKGMVGQAVIRALKKNGYCDPKYGGNLITQTKNKLDLTNYSDVNDWFKINKPNVVVIAAAKVGGIYANFKYPYEFISENLRIAHNIIEAACLNGSRRLLFLGSSCIYPKNANIPIKEEELLSSYLESTNEPYAIAKIAGIKLCEYIRKQYNFDAISLMPTNLYGPGDNYDSEKSHVFASLIKRFILAKKNNIKSITCWGTGKPMREFLHVDDLGSACIYVLEKWDPDSIESPKDKNNKSLSYLNIGTGEEISIKNLANKISLITKYNGKIIWDNEKPDGTYRKVLDSSRIKSIGWEPKISLQTGLIKEINYIQKVLNTKSDLGKSLKNFL